MEFQLNMFVNRWGEMQRVVISWRKAAERIPEFIRSLTVESREKMRQHLFVD